MLCGGGCTHLAAHKQAAVTRLTEESRVLTTGVVDTLNEQPSADRDSYSAVALTLAKQAQRLAGLPAQPLEVRPLIAEEERRRAVVAADTNAAAGSAAEGPATAALAQRFAAQDAWLAEERRLGARLEQMGAQRELERNTRLRRWTKLLGFGGLGLGGLVAVVVLLPAAVPLLGRLLAGLVGRLPALAGAVGVVSVKAFDAVVRGIERFKGASAAATARPGSSPEEGSQPASSAEAPALLNTLSREMDAAHKALVRQRRPRQNEPAAGS